MNDADKINNIRRNIYLPLRKAGLMPSTLNPGNVGGPGAHKPTGYARGGMVGPMSGRPMSGRPMSRRRPVTRSRRNFSGRKYASGGHVNNFTTRSNIRNTKRSRYLGNRRFRNRTFR